MEPALSPQRPACGDDHVRSRQLETFEVHVRWLIAGQHGPCEDSLGIGQAHEGQEAQVVPNGLIKLSAESGRRRTGSGQGRGHRHIDDILAGTIDINLHGRAARARRAEQQQAEQEKDSECELKCFHGVFVFCVV